MKKLFFAALVATVAVGGAFASQNSSSLANIFFFKAPGSLTCIPVDCHPNNLGTPCVIISGQYFLGDCTTAIIPSGNRP